MAAYALGWCKGYAECISKFVKEPVENRCVHCLPQGDSKRIFGQREAVRRCCEKFGSEAEVDSFDISVGEDSGEVFLIAKMTDSTKDDNLMDCHLGARCGIDESPLSENSKNLDPIRVVKPTEEEQEVLKGEKEVMSVIPGMAEWTRRYQKEEKTKNRLKKTKLRGKQLQGVERLLKLAKGLVEEDLLAGVTGSSQDEERVEVRKLSVQKATIVKVANQILKTWCSEQGSDSHWTTLEIKVDGERVWRE